jgi:ribonucleotide reductase alpha subunit
MRIINEIGRNVMQGGSRRSAIWAGLRWDHQDILDFIHEKNWSENVKLIKATDYNFPAALDMTNISVQLNDEFFDAYSDAHHKKHELARKVYTETVRQMVLTAEPGFSVDIGNNKGETLRNAPVTGGTYVLTRNGYATVSSIVGLPTTIWTGKSWAPEVVFKETSSNAKIVKVHMSGGREIRCEPNHEFLIEKYRGAGKRRSLVSVDRVSASALIPGSILHVALPRQFSLSTDTDAYALGYAYGDGSISRSGKVEITLCTTESRKALATLVKAKNFSSVRDPDPRGFARIYYSTDPLLAGATKGVFPDNMYSASSEEQASFIAGLFDSDGNWEPTQGRLRLASKHQGFLRGTARLLEQMGILSGVSKAGMSTYGKSQGWQLVVMADYTDIFIDSIPTLRLQPTKQGLGYRRSTVKVLSVEEEMDTEAVYCADVNVPEHSFMAEGVIISNCTEVTSADDSDICNLGSINLARISSPLELESVIELGILFLLAGSVYSHTPFEKVEEVRNKNRRLGLGIMGVHEWLATRGRQYGPDEELGSWLGRYSRSTEIAAEYAQGFGLSAPKKTRAIAPTGTIGIVAETTTGIEPIFSTAFKRRYLEGGSTWKYQLVVDPTAKRLVDLGVNPYDIEDAYQLSYDVERRVAFQRWVQSYVDHGISSTINLPAPLHGNSADKFGIMLMRHLHGLRGVTVYPDGARGGQPLTQLPLVDALGHEGVVYEEDESKCIGGVCGA